MYDPENIIWHIKFYRNSVKRILYTFITIKGYLVTEKDLKLCLRENSDFLFRHLRPLAIHKYPGPGYNTLLLQLIPGDLYSVCPHRQFHTLPSLLQSQIALPNSNPKPACQVGRQFVPFYFTMVF